MRDRAVPLVAFAFAASESGGAAREAGRATGRAGKSAGKRSGGVGRPLPPPHHPSP